MARTASTNDLHWLVVVVVVVTILLYVAAATAAPSSAFTTSRTPKLYDSYPRSSISITRRSTSSHRSSRHRTAFVPLESATIQTTPEYDNNAAMMIDNPITSAGLSFISASSKSLGMLFYNIGGLDHKDIQALLLQAGTHLVHAGEYWYSDWSIVQDSMLHASKSFYDISNVFGSANIDESLPLGTLFENISFELQDISNISGCCSVGPPCSVPNLLAIQEHLMGVSSILKKNSVASTDEHMMVTLFREVAELFGTMAGRYVDDVEGQTSEVTI